jgi:hypothetical protein
MREKKKDAKGRVRTCDSSTTETVVDKVRARGWARALQHFQQPQRRAARGR